MSGMMSVLSTVWRFKLALAICALGAALLCHHVQTQVLWRRLSYKASTLRVPSSEWVGEWELSIIEEPSMIRDVSMAVQTFRNEESRSRQDTTIRRILEGSSSSENGLKKTIFGSERSYLQFWLFVLGLAGHIFIGVFLILVDILRVSSVSKSMKEIQHPQRGTRRILYVISGCTGTRLAMGVVVLFGALCVGIQHRVYMTPTRRALSADVGLAIVIQATNLLCYLAILVLVVLPVLISSIVRYVLPKLETFARLRNIQIPSIRPARLIAVGMVLLVLLVMWSLSHEDLQLGGTETPQSLLYTTVLGPNFDICTKVGLHQKSKLTNSIVWPDLLPRRILNFFMGAETCSDPTSPSATFPGGSPGVTVSRRLTRLHDKGSTREMKYNDDLAKAKPIHVPQFDVKSSEFDSVVIDSVQMEVAEQAFWDEVPVVGSAEYAAWKRGSTTDTQTIEERNLLGYANPYMKPPPTDTYDGLTLKTYEVHPALRRLFPRAGRRFSEYDENTGELLVAASCKPVLLDHQLQSSTLGVKDTDRPPTVIVEDLERNNLGINRVKLPVPTQDHFEPGSDAWINYVQQKYVASSLEVPPITYDSWGVSHPLWSFPDRVFECEEVSLDAPQRVHQGNTAGSRRSPCTIYSRHTATSKGAYKKGILTVRVEQTISSDIYPLIPPNHAPSRALSSSVTTLLHPHTNRTLRLPTATLPVPHYRVPLWSSAVSVICDGGSEEVHIHPLVHNTRRQVSVSPKASKSSSNFATPEEEEDTRHTNVIWLMMDAIGRQDVRRSLKRMQSWLRYMQSRQRTKRVDDGSKWLAPVGAWELKGATTIGHSTAGNYVPSFTGIPTRKDWHLTEQEVFNAAAHTNLVYLMKKRRLDHLLNASDEELQQLAEEGEYPSEEATRPTYTAMLGTSCMPVQRDMMNIFGGDADIATQVTMLANRLNTTLKSDQGISTPPYLLGFHFPPNAAFTGTHIQHGEGEGFNGGGLTLDTDMYFPTCHRDVGAVESNAQGPNSIVRRCLGERQSHDHILPYLEDLLVDLLIRHPGRFGGGSIGPRIFSVLTFMEGHEGSHTVMALGDRSIYRFLRRLELLWGFFDDGRGDIPSSSRPRGMVLLSSDHGNHMGPFYEWTDAGFSERTMPYAVFAGNSPASSPNEMAALDAASTCPTTAVDLYLTLGQMLGIRNETRASTVYEYNDVSSSLLHPKRLEGCASKTQCSDVGAVAPCTLSFCKPVTGLQNPKNGL